MNVKHLMMLERRMKEGINKDKVLSEIENFKEYGVTKEKRKKKIQKKKVLKI